MNKRAVSRVSVRVTKRVVAHDEVIDTSTIVDELEVEPVARDVIPKRRTKPRLDGDTLILPVMEEITVVEKRLVLVEELYISGSR